MTPTVSSIWPKVLPIVDLAQDDEDMEEIFYRQSMWHKTMKMAEKFHRQSIGNKTVKMERNVLTS